MKQTNSLIKNYETSVNKIVDIFLLKQGFDKQTNDWIGGIGTGVLCIIGEYYFDFEDVLLDLKNNCEPEFILKWHNETIDSILKNSENRLNYKSYINGLKYEMTTDQQKLIKEGFECNGGSDKGLYECYTKKLDEVTSIKVTYPLFEVILKQHTQSIELHNIVNIQQLLSFVNQF
jgi:hypothetical protein